MRRVIGNNFPKGWLKDFLQEDLQNGVVGKLDLLVPDLFKDDIYINDRLSLNTKPKDLGTVENDDSWNVQFYWWNSETQSNYYDGYLRYAFLLKDEYHIELIRKHVYKIIDSQDEDGYLGIYEKDLRYNFATENGELWSKTTLYRYLLAYYYYTLDQNVIETVIKAVKNVMDNYKINNSKPFKNVDGFAGLTHGLMFTDVCFQLFQITYDKAYLCYARFLYEDYNKYKQSEEDIKKVNLKNIEYKFTGHGVHTYEHLRSVLVANMIDNEYQGEIKGYYQKLKNVISPSGGPIGDEWVMKNTAKSDEHGYEYCSIFELLDSYLHDLLIGNNVKVLDEIENIFLNASFGSRHLDHNTIAYLKSDDSYSMEGHFHNEQEHSPHQIQTRYKYSPTHQDAAVCCVPNATRTVPYYIENQYYVDNDTIYMNYFIPTSLDYLGLRIDTITDYPFNNKVKLIIKNKNSRIGKLFIRKIDKTIDLKDGIYEFQVDFNVTLHNHFDKKYIKYGPLLYTLPIKGKDVIVKNYTGTNFSDIHVTRVDDVPNYKLDLTRIDEVKYIENPGLYNNKLLVPFKDDEKEIFLELVPFGRSTLRKTTFVI